MHDSECGPSTACVNQRCQDPCADGNPCGNNAECRVRNNRPICSCPTGWGGDPQVQCFKRKIFTPNSKFQIETNLRNITVIIL